MLAKGVAVSQDEIDAIRKLLASKPRPVGWAERRQRLDEVGSLWPVADDVSLEAVNCDGVPGEWSLAPGSDRSRVLIFFHGGGYCSGSILSHRRMVTEAGRAARMRTLAIGYRLAPEHPYPAAHEDAMTAWHFVRRQGIPADSIAVGGDSAGGNLSITLINRLRAADEPLPACAWLISPWTDLTMSGAGRRRPDYPQGLPRRIGRGLCADGYRSREPADLAAIRGFARLPADFDPGRIGGDVARGCHAVRRRGRIGRR
jgi:monoterpene epsilon-lactone hydrolase